MRRAFDTLFYITLLLWPLTGYAAGVTLSKTIGGVSRLDWALVAALSLVAGLVALLQLMRKDVRKYEELLQNWVPDMNPPPEPRWSTYLIFLHMLLSLIAGIAVFFGCEAYDVEDFREALLIGIGAYSGAKTLDIFTNGLTGALQGFITGSTNKT